jgi:hypothetical protein
MTNPDDLFLAEWHAERDKTGGEYTEPGDELWTARPALAHVREFAQACRASPWATLGVVLARVIAATPPFVVLPRLVGKQGSLNMFVGIVGEPGRGKGTADGAAADALELPGEIPEINPGSGEGIAHMFGRRKPGGEIEPVYESVLVTVAEIGTLAALGARSGSTLLPELKKAWMGESLGFWNANPAKRIGIRAHSYRCCLSAGIQPKRAQVLFDDTEGGLPQRFLWVPATDPYAPIVKPDIPDPWPWKLPTWPVADYVNGRVQLPVCKAARDYVDQHRLLTVSGAPMDPLDVHTPLVRLKVATGIALLDQHAGVRDTDWYLSGLVMDQSNAVRGRVLRALDHAAVEANRKKGQFEAERAVIIDDKVASAAAVRAGKAMMTKLAQAEGDGWMTRVEVKRATASRDRGYADDALAGLVMTGHIEVEDIPNRNGGVGQRYRIRK